MEEIKEKLKKLEDYEVLEFFKQELNDRFDNNKYELGFDSNRQTDSFIISLKLLMDCYI